MMQVSPPRPILPSPEKKKLPVFTTIPTDPKEFKKFMEDYGYEIDLPYTGPMPPRPASPVKNKEEMEAILKESGWYNSEPTTW